MKRGPKKAIVLGAGFGSRLSPLTLDCPKPLIPVRGVPLIARLFADLQRWGVEEVLVNLHHGAERMIEELPDLCPQGLRLTVSMEPEILGTGGALRRMAWFWGEEPLWVCNADVVQQVDPTPLVKEMKRHQPLACLWMVPDSGPRTVTVTEGKVIDFRGGGMTFSGLHLLRRDVLEYLPREEVFSSVISAYEQAMSQGEVVRGVCVPGSEWEDAGTPERLLAVNGGSLIFPGAQVDEGARLEQALVGPGARVRRGRRMSGMVLSPERGLDEREQVRLSTAEAVECLPARGSDRSFARVHLPRGSMIRVRTGSARPENAHTAGHLRFLARKGIRVPEVHYAAKDGSLLLLEDVGRTHLLDRLRTGSAVRNRRDMKQVVAMTAAFHRLRPGRKVVLESPFSPKLYRWEHELFFNEFLARHDPKADLSGLRKALKRLAQALVDQPQVLVHRDLQSENILWKDGKPVLIDVQAMRMGPAAYDLGSLLADPYVDRDRELQEDLLQGYNDEATQPVSIDMLAAGSCQRLVQALGAYGRLGARPETRRFLMFVRPAVRQLRHWAPDGALGEWAEAFFMRQDATFRLECATE